MVVVMGVAGSGKSTLARALAHTLGWEFLEGDDHHPAANVTKMTQGIPLDDADRAPWLARLNGLLAASAARGRDVVLACSALGPGHRERLARGLPPPRFVYLCGDREVIRARIAGRPGHFMPAALLDSQLAALDPPEDAVVVAVEWPTAAQVRHVVGALGLAGGPRP